MKLYIVYTGIGSFYTVAEDPAEAEKKVVDRLTEINYGAPCSRAAIKIEVVASSDAFTGNESYRDKLVL